MAPVDDDGGLERDAALAADLVREAALLAARIRQEGLDVERKTSGSDVVTQADTRTRSPASAASRSSRAASSTVPP